MASSSAPGGGNWLAQGSRTTTWQVAQVRLPPQSAAMPSTPPDWAACIRLRPVFEEIVAEPSAFGSLFAMKWIVIMVDEKVGAALRTG
jgi:hypothetical protein